MATKFPLEMITTLSNAPANSPVIWTGTDLIVTTDTDYNLGNIVSKLNTYTNKLDAYLADNAPALQEVLDLSQSVSSILLSNS